MFGGLNFIKKSILIFHLSKPLLLIIGLVYRVHTSIRDEVIEVRRGRKKILISKELSVYLFDMITKFDCYFNSVVPQHKKNFEVVDFSKPKIHKLKKSKIPIFFNSIAEDEWPLDGYLDKYVPKEGDIVFDCGAYCGVMTYFFSRMVGKTGKVYAFEPDEKNYDALIKNIEYHKLSNVVPVEMGISSETSSLLFNAEGCLGGAFAERVDRSVGSMGEVLTGSVISQPPVEIKTVSIEDACKQYGIKKVDFVKMDIEGAEIDAIIGSKEFIKKNNINFAIASYHIVNGNPAYKKLEKVFEEIGYEAKTEFPIHRTTFARKPWYKINNK